MSRPNHLILMTRICRRIEVPTIGTNGTRGRIFVNCPDHALRPVPQEDRSGPPRGRVLTDLICYSVLQMLQSLP